MKKFLKGLGIFFACMLVIGACTNLVSEDTETEQVAAEPKKEEKEPKKEEKKEEPKKEEPKKKEPKKEQKKEEPVVDNAVLEGMALGLLEENFAGVAKISFDKDSKAFSVTPTDPVFTTELLMMMNGTKSADDWNGLVNSTVYMSESTNSLLGGGYSIAIINPANTDNTLLMIIDGVVIYNAFE